MKTVSQINYLEYKQRVLDMVADMASGPDESAIGLFELQPHQKAIYKFLASVPEVYTLKMPGIQRGRPVILALAEDKPPLILENAKWVELKIEQ